MKIDQQPIGAECGRCGHGTLTIYKDGAVCSNCSPEWLDAMLRSRHEEWKRTTRSKDWTGVDGG